jgi:hypothetical protein
MYLTVVFTLFITNFAFGEERRRLGITNKNVIFVWFSARLALSLPFERIINKEYGNDKV